MAMKDWECATPGCGHLEYRHSGFAGEGSCGVVTGRRAKGTNSKKDEGDAGKLCPCTRYQAPAAKQALMLR